MTTTSPPDQPRAWWSTDHDHSLRCWWNWEIGHWMCQTTAPTPTSAPTGPTTRQEQP